MYYEDSLVESYTEYTGMYIPYCRVHKPVLETGLYTRQAYTQDRLI